MKRRIGIIIILAAFLAIPLTAHATLYTNYEGTASLDVTRYNFADYEGTVTDPVYPFTYSTGPQDIFCVEDDEGAPSGSIEYLFYSFSGTGTLDTKIENNDNSEWERATWIADYWMVYIDNVDNPNQGNRDFTKRQAQMAVWWSLGMGNVNESLFAHDIFEAAEANGVGHVTANWYLAINTENQTQDYLTQKNPVPEPATFLMLGSGLLVLAGFGRRRFREK